MPDAAAFWDKLADKYAKKPVKDAEGYERTLESTRKRLSAGDEVLELGCGTGTTALLLAPSVRQITATDISSRMIAIAQEKAQAQGVENVRFVRATLSDGDRGEGPFDVVLAFNFLHLLEDIPAAVRRIDGLLRPGGWFVSKTVCLAEQSRFWGAAVAVMRRLRLAPYVQCLKVAELEEILTCTGFEVIEAASSEASIPSRFIVARKP
jgi:ubiquinone/menaquinone biosynthesis C-methylase UbiE